MNGPYVVTVKRGEDLVSRCAVATLAEARAYVGAECSERYEGADLGPEGARLAEAISGQGGGIGPLPDATLIVVERVQWEELVKAARRVPGHEVWLASSSQEQIIAAFNETQEAQR